MAQYVMGGSSLSLGNLGKQINATKGQTQALKDEIVQLKRQLAQVGKSGNGFSNINTQIDSLLRQIQTLGSSATKIMQGLFGSIQNFSDIKFSSITSQLSSIKTAVQAISQNITNNINSITSVSQSGLKGMLSDATANISTLNSNFDRVFKAIQKTVQTSSTKAAKIMVSNLQQLSRTQNARQATKQFDDLTNAISRVSKINPQNLNSLASIMSKITQGFKDYKLPDSFTQLQSLSQQINGFVNSVNQMKDAKIGATINEILTVSGGGKTSGQTIANLFQKLKGIQVNDNLNKVISSLIQLNKVDNLGAVSQGFTKIKQVSNDMNPTNIQSLWTAIKDMVGDKGVIKVSEGFQQVTRSLGDMADALSVIFQTKQWFQNIGQTIKRFAEQSQTAIDGIRDNLDSVFTKTESQKALNSMGDNAKQLAQYATVLSQAIASTQNKTNASSQTARSFAQNVTQLSSAMATMTKWFGFSDQKSSTFSSNLQTLSGTISRLTSQISKLFDQLIVTMAYMTKIQTNSDMTGFIQNMATAMYGKKNSIDSTNLYKMWSNLQDTFKQVAGQSQNSTNTAYKGLDRVRQLIESVVGSASKLVPQMQKVKGSIITDAQAQTFGHVAEYVTTINNNLSPLIRNFKATADSMSGLLQNMKQVASLSEQTGNGINKTTQMVKQAIGVQQKQSQTQEQRIARATQVQQILQRTYQTMQQAESAFIKTITSISNMFVGLRQTISDVQKDLIGLFKDTKSTNASRNLIESLSTSSKEIAQAFKSIQQFNVGAAAQNFTNYERGLSHLLEFVSGTQIAQKIQKYRQQMETLRGLTIVDQNLQQQISYVRNIFTKLSGAFAQMKPDSYQEVFQSLKASGKYNQQQADQIAQTATALSYFAQTVVKMDASLENVNKQTSFQIATDLSNAVQTLNASIAQTDPALIQQTAGKFGDFKRAIEDIIGVLQQFKEKINDLYIGNKTDYVGMNPQDFNTLSQAIQKLSQTTEQFKSIDGAKSSMQQFGQTINTIKQALDGLTTSQTTYISASTLLSKTYQNIGTQLSRVLGGINKKNGEDGYTKKIDKFDGLVNKLQQYRNKLIQVGADPQTMSGFDKLDVALSKARTYIDQVNQGQKQIDGQKLRSLVTSVSTAFNSLNTGTVSNTVSSFKQIISLQNSTTGNMPLFSNAENIQINLQSLKTVIDSLAVSLKNLQTNSLANTTQQANQQVQKQIGFIDQLKQAVSNLASGTFNSKGSADNLLGKFDTQDIVDKINNIINALSKLSDYVNKDNYTPLSTAISGLKTSFSDSQIQTIASSMTDVFTQLGQVAQQITGASGQISSSIQQQAGIINSTLNSISGTITSIIGQFQQFGQSLNQVFGSISGGFIQMNRTLSQGINVQSTNTTAQFDPAQIQQFTQMLQNLATQATQTQEALRNGVTGSGFGESIGKIISQLDSLKTSLDSIIGKIGQIGQVKISESSFDGIAKSIKQMSDAFASSEKNILKAIQGLGKFSSTAKQAGQAGTNAVKEIASTISGATKEGQKAATVITSAITDIQKITTRLSSDGSVQMIVSGLSEAGEKVRQVWDQNLNVISQSTTWQQDMSSSSQKSITALVSLYSQLGTIITAKYNAESKGYQQVASVMADEQHRILSMISQYGQLYNEQNQVIKAKQKLAVVQAQISDKRSQSYIKSQESVLKSAISLQKQYYEAWLKMKTSTNNADETRYYNEAKAIQEKIAALEKEYEWLQNNAKYTSQTSQIKSTAESKNQSAQIQAAIKLLEKQYALKQKLVGMDSSSAEYSIISKQIDKLGQKIKINFSDAVTSSMDYQNALKKVEAQLENVKKIYADETKSANDKKNIADLVKLYDQLGKAYAQQVKSRGTVQEQNANAQVASIQQQIDAVLKLSSAYKEQTVIKQAASKAEQTKIQAQSTAAKVQDIKNLTESYNKLKSLLDKLKSTKLGDQQASEINTLIASVKQSVSQFEKLSEAQQLARLGAQGFAKVSSAKNDATQSQSALVQSLIQEYQNLVKVYEQATTAKANNDATTSSTKATQAATMLDNINAKYSEQLRLLPEVQNAINAVTDAQTKLSNTNLGANLTDQYSKVKDTMENVKKSIERLSAAKKQFEAYAKAGNYTGMTEQAAKVAVQNEYLSATQKSLSSLGLQSEQIKKIIALIKQATQAQKQKGNATKSSVAIGDKLLSQLMSMVRMYIGIQGIRRLWTNAKTYAMEYYDALNEIRIVTGKNEEYAQRLGQKYVNLAKKMSVTSTQIASAAVVFARQGREESEVDDMLNWTIKFAKTAGIEFEEAASLVTAAVNGMQVDAQRAVDVFTYLGNHSASSAADVAEAMEKVSAAAGQFGLSIEWVGSYIATIVDRTQQDASSVGNALNTIIARLHSIKSKGYNEQDATKINDVAKALNTVGIQLLNSQGEWRDMSTIFEQIAKKWGTMGDAQRSYIATTMAGVRQQNYFLTLMDDMSAQWDANAKAAGKTSKAYELYKGALGSVNEVTTAYATYLESTQAAQDRLKQSLEQLYNTFLNGKALKSLYNMLSGIVKAFVTWTQNTNGLNISIITITASCLTLVAVLHKINKVRLSWSSMAKSSKLSMYIALAAVIAQIATAISSLVTQARKSAMGIGQFTNAISDLETQASKLSGQINTVKDKINQLNKLMYKKSQGKNLTSQELQTVNTLLNDIVQSSDTYAAAINGIDTSDGQAQVQALNSKLRQQVSLLNQTNAGQSALKLKDKDTLKGWASTFVDNWNTYARSTWDDGSFTVRDGNNDVVKYKIGNVQFDDWNSFMKIVKVQGWGGSNYIKGGTRTTQKDADDFFKAYGFTLEQVGHVYDRIKDMGLLDASQADYKLASSSGQAARDSLKAMYKQIAGYIVQQGNIAQKYGFTDSQIEEITQQVADTLWGYGYNNHSSMTTQEGMKNLVNYGIEYAYGASNGYVPQYAKTHTKQGNAIWPIIQDYMPDANYDDYSSMIADAVTAGINPQTLKQQIAQRFQGMLKGNAKAADYLLKAVLGDPSSLNDQATLDRYAAQAYADSLNIESWRDIWSNGVSLYNNAKKTTLGDSNVTMKKLPSLLSEIGMDPAQIIKDIDAVNNAISSFGNNADLIDLAIDFFSADSFDQAKWNALIAKATELNSLGGTASDQTYWPTFFTNAKSLKSTKSSDKKMSLVEQMITGMDSQNWNQDLFISSVRALNAAGDDLTTIQNNLGFAEGWFMQAAQGLENGTMTIDDMIKDIKLAKFAMKFKQLSQNTASAADSVYDFSELFTYVGSDATVLDDAINDASDQVYATRMARYYVDKYDGDPDKQDEYIRKYTGVDPNKTMDHDALMANFTARQAKVERSMQLFLDYISQLYGNAIPQENISLIMASGNTDSTVKILLDAYTRMRDITGHDEQAQPVGNFWAQANTKAGKSKIQSAIRAQIDDLISYILSDDFDFDNFSAIYDANESDISSLASSLGIGNFFVDMKEQKFGSKEQAARVLRIKQQALAYADAADGVMALGDAFDGASKTQAQFIDATQSVYGDIVKVKKASVDYAAATTAKEKAKALADAYGLDENLPLDVLEAYHKSQQRVVDDTLEAIKTTAEYVYGKKIDWANTAKVLADAQVPDEVKNLVKFVNWVNTIDLTTETQLSNGWTSIAGMSDKRIYGTQKNEVMGFIYELLNDWNQEAFNAAYEVEGNADKFSSLASMLGLDEHFFDNLYTNYNDTADSAQTAARAANELNLALHALDFETATGQFYDLKTVMDTAYTQDVNTFLDSNSGILQSVYTARKARFDYDFAAAQIYDTEQQRQDAMDQAIRNAFGVDQYKQWDSERLKKYMEAQEAIADGSIEQLLKIAGQLAGMDFTNEAKDQIQYVIDNIQDDAVRNILQLYLDMSNIDIKADEDAFKSNGWYGLTTVTNHTMFRDRQTDAYDLLQNLMRNNMSELSSIYFSDEYQSAFDSLATQLGLNEEFFRDLATGAMTLDEALIKLRSAKAAFDFSDTTQSVLDLTEAFTNAESEGTLYAEKTSGIVDSAYNTRYARFAYNTATTQAEKDQAIRDAFGIDSNKKWSSQKLLAYLTRQQDNLSYAMDYLYDFLNDSFKINWKNLDAQIAEAYESGDLAKANLLQMYKDLASIDVASDERVYRQNGWSGIVQMSENKLYPNRKEQALLALMGVLGSTRFNEAEFRSMMEYNDGQYANQLDSFGSDLGLGDQFFSKIARGQITVKEAFAQIQVAADKLNFDKPNAQLLDFSAALDALDGSSQNFLSAAMSTVEQAQATMMARLAYNTGATQNEKKYGIVQALGLGDEYLKLSLEHLQSILTQRQTALANSLTNIQDLVDSILDYNVDWQNQSIINYIYDSENTPQSVKYLLDLYNLLKQVSGASTDATSSLDTFFKSASYINLDTSTAKANYLGGLISMLNIDGASEQLQQMIRDDVSGQFDFIEQIIGTQMFTAIKQGKTISSDALIMALKEKMSSLRLDSAQARGQVSDQFSDMLSGFLSGQDSQFDSSSYNDYMSNMMQRYGAIQRYNSRSYNGDDLSILGVTGTGQDQASQVRIQQAQLATDIASLTTDAEYLWSIISQLTNVELGDTNGLRAWIGNNPSSELAPVAQYLLDILNYAEQLSGINPFYQMANVVLTDKDVTQNDQLTYLMSLYAQLATGGEQAFGQFQNMIMWLNENSNLDSFAQSLGLDADALVRLTGTSGTASSALSILLTVINSLGGSNGKSSRYFSEINKKIKQMTQNADKAAAAIQGVSIAIDMFSKLNTFNEAMDQYDAAQQKVASQGLSALTTDDVSNLASLLEMPAQALIQSWSQVPGWIDAYVNEANASMSQLQQDLFMKITGTSMADFSNLENGLIAADETAQAMLQTLAQSGMFTLEDEQVDQYVDVLQSDGTIVQKHLKGTYQILKPANGNPFSSSNRSKKGGSGGGGGGGGGSSGGRTKEEIFVDKSNWELERIKNSVTQLNTIMNSWSSDGYFTSMISGYEQLNDYLEKQNDLLKEYVAEAEAWLPGLYEQLSKETEGTQAYDKILSRIETIQSALVSWNQNLEQNDAQLKKNAQAIKDMNDQIRQLDIDLENEILKAIENREEKIQQKLQARISMENTILDILKKQAEEQEQAILDSIQAQVEALNKEKQAISEILQKRKEEAELQKEQDELSQMRQKYNRISVDPTRAKEAAELLKQIQEKQEEMAWESAERQADAQIDSIDQQIDSLDDYKEYIQNYYDELLENPRNFIQQIDSILAMSQEDILKWLVENSEEYANSTDSTREQTVQSWTDTLNQMQGVITNHWEQVQYIISQGNDYILNFLKENSSEYAEASKLQQQAYIEGWEDMFEKIAKAHEKLKAQILDTSNFQNTALTQEATEESSSGGGGGSGGGSGKDDGDKVDGKNHYYILNGKKYDGYKTTNEAKAALNVALGNWNRQTDASVRASLSGKGLTNEQIQTQVKAALTKKTYSYYKNGGYVDYTGPAWVDGSKANPEYMLNAGQTKLMEALVSALETTVRIPRMSAFDVSAMNGSNAMTTINGGITIQVDQLATDDDYEEIAEKVKQSIVDAMTHGKSISI